MTGKVGPIGLLTDRVNTLLRGDWNDRPGQGLGYRPSKLLLTRRTQDATSAGGGGAAASKQATRAAGHTNAKAVWEN